MAVSDHDPVGMRMELEMREGTRGKCNFSSERREDGAWVYRIERKGG